MTIAGGNDVGRKLHQLSYPQAICIDDEQNICIADWWNNRIVEWKNKAKVGRIVMETFENGDQLNRPTDVIIDQETNSFIVSDCENGRIIRISRQNNANREILLSDIDCVNLAMDKDGSLYVSNGVKNEVKRWRRGEIEGTIVAGGNGKGHQLNQLNHPTFLCVTEDRSLYISDMNNHRVMKWTEDAREGIVVAGGNENGNHLTQLSYPEGLAIDQSGHIYIADSLNHRIVRWNEGSREGTMVVGGNGQGHEGNQFNGPIDLSFDRHGNLYVVDCWNHRVQKFEIDYDYEAGSSN